MKLMTEIIQFIEDNLSEDLNVESVATRSGYSTHHFQRMFAAVTGLSMGSYIRRRRLTKAARGVSPYKWASKPVEDNSVHLGHLAA